MATINIFTSKEDQLKEIDDMIVKANDFLDEGILEEGTKFMY